MFEELSGIQDEFGMKKHTHEYILKKIATEKDLSPGTVAKILCGYGWYKAE